MENEWIKSTLERLEKNLVSINVTLALNTQSLETHIKRTELLEARVKPLEASALRVSGGIKVLAIVWGGIGSALGIATAILKLLGKL